MPAVTSADASRRTPSDNGAVASSARSASRATARRQRIRQAAPLRVSSYRGHATDLVCTRRVVVLSLSSGPGLFSGMRRPTASVVRVGVHCGIPIAWDLDSWLGKDDPCRCCEGCLDGQSSAGEQWMCHCQEPRGEIRSHFRGGEDYGPSSSRVVQMFHVKLDTATCQEPAGLIVQLFGVWADS